MQGRRTPLARSSAGYAVSRPRHRSRYFRQGQHGYDLPIPRCGERLARSGMAGFVAWPHVARVHEMISSASRTWFTTMLHSWPSASSSRGRSQRNDDGATGSSPGTLMARLSAARRP